MTTRAPTGRTKSKQRSRPAPARKSPAAREQARQADRRRTPARSAANGARSDAVDAYIGRAAPFAQPILRKLRALMHRGCPSVVETIKWGMPAFEYHGPLAGMAAFKHHCVLGFWKGTLLSDPSGTLQTQARTAMGNFGCIRSVDDLPSDATLVRLVKDAARLNEAGVKVPKEARQKKPIRPPIELTRALRAAPKAQAVLAAMSPSHRREYLEWIVEAKRQETRERRIATAISWLSKGLNRNWKYERRARA